MIQPDRIEEENRKRKPRPMYDFAMVAELSALHELSALAFAETEDQLVREALEKATRLFGARLFAVLSGRPPRQQLVLSSGCMSREEVLSKMARSGDSDHRLMLAFNEGTEDQDVMYFEQARVLDDRIRRLYNVFGRRLEDRLASFRQEARRRQAEEALRRTESRFHRALENLPAIVAVYDSELRIRFINAITQMLTGRPPADYLGQRGEDAWPAEVSRVCLPLIRQAFASGQPQTLETDLSFLAGESQSMLVTCIPLAGENGQVEEVVGILQGIGQPAAQKSPPPGA